MSKVNVWIHKNLKHELKQIQKSLQLEEDEKKKKKKKRITLQDASRELAKYLNSLRNSNK